ncbi:6003_t:CDS:2, partial [Gigaspora margarita]
EIAMIFQDPIVYHALSTHIVEALKESILNSPMEPVPETARIMKQEIREDKENVPDLSFVLKFGTNEINILNTDDLAMKVLGNDLLDRYQNDNIIALRQALDCFDI